MFVRINIKGYACCFVYRENWIIQFSEASCDGGQELCNINGLICDNSNVIGCLGRN